ncbi:ubiquinol-cytochrome c reductase cytochrome b subunit [Micrococcales bacterium 31B]|nr:ubiquinol-cytochrome c reductase cytochrome b subunit [Micrococcales bacterium 31B]
MSSSTTTPPATDPRIAATADWVDQRFGVSKAVREFSRKIFPDHWSFMLGEVAMYSFVILLLSGTFLTFFFVPSMTEVVYDGVYEPLVGLPMSEAYYSTLHMSFEVRGGLLMRQIHHWAALIFVASMMVHMFRVFFTGAFRKPREINWLIGVTLFILGMLAGFSGYSLPDDVLSGNGLRIADGVVKAIPIIGTYMSFYMFGGEFPGHALIPRLFTVHILLIPAAILGLMVVHLFLVFMHKHTQYPGPGRTNTNVVGFPLFPVYTAKAGGFFFIVFGVIALLSATTAINSVWVYGPYDPSPIGAGSQPDWYMLFLEGTLRLMPGFAEYQIGGFTLSLNVLVPALVAPAILFIFLMAWPFIEAWVTGDRGEHHLLDRPRNAPTRTGLGVAWVVAYFIMCLAGSNDIIATHFHLSINDITNVFRGLIFIGPWIAFMVTKRICLSLQRKDREIALHGRETGKVVRLPHGEFIEVHEQLSDYDRWLLVQHEAHAPFVAHKTLADGAPNPNYKKDLRRQRWSNFLYRDRIEPVTPAELRDSLEHGHGHHDHEDLHVIEHGGVMQLTNDPEGAAKH